MKEGTQAYLGLFPRVGISMRLFKVGGHCTIFHKNTLISRIELGLGKPLSQLKAEERCELQYPVHTIVASDEQFFYPIIDTLGLTFAKTRGEGIEAINIPVHLFSGIQSVGVKVTIRSLGLFFTDWVAPAVSAVYMHIGSNLGAVVLFDIVDQVMHLFLLDTHEHPPMKIARILDVCPSSVSELHAIADVHKQKHFNSKHCKYLNDWE
ncbi:MAG: hypothetical protein RR280_00975 [Bacteroidaceae bacterium]